jgi:hypothetical protein
VINSKAVIAWKRPLSNLAFESLRSAQRKKKRRILQDTVLWRNVETNSFAQISPRPDLVLSNTESAHKSVLTLGITSQTYHSDHSKTALGTVENTSPEKTCWHSTALVTKSPACETCPGAAVHCYTNITTPVQKASAFSNHNDVLDANVATTDRIFASQSDLLPSNSATVQRAPTLSNYTADGSTAYDAIDQYIAMTERISYQPTLLHNNSAMIQRAPIFSNYTADGAIAYDDTPAQDMAGMEAAPVNLLCSEVTPLQSNHQDTWGYN